MHSGSVPRSTPPSSPSRRSRGPLRPGRSTLTLDIALLGPAEVLVDGAPLSVDTRKAVALLAYLAMTGRPAAREQVAVLLQGANLKAPSYKVTWHDDPAAATGVDDHLARRVAVTVRP